MKGFSEVWIVHYVQIGLYLGKRQISPVLLRWIEMNLLTTMIYHDLIFLELLPLVKTCFYFNL